MKQPASSQNTTREICNSIKRPRVEISEDETPGTSQGAVRDCSEHPRVAVAAESTCSCNDFTGTTDESEVGLLENCDVVQSSVSKLSYDNRPTERMQKCTVPLDGQPASCSTIVDSMLPFEPYQPLVTDIPHQYAGKDKKNCLKFQESWYRKFPWIHYDTSISGVLCFTCRKVESLNLFDLSRNREQTFIKTGFKNWKKALQRFSEHANCSSHRFAQEQLAFSCKPTIDAQLSQQCSEQQKNAQKSLTTIFSTVRYLARQGLAFRGHEAEEGNFKELLRVRSTDVSELQTFMHSTKNDMTSGVRQNEIIDLFSQAIVREICSDIREAGSFAIIVDGTQDLAGKEQESICVRYVDQTLNPVEAFVGMYDMSESTTGLSIASCVLDALIRLQLPVEQLRGQTYDGASNMSGKYNGCQAIIRDRQPLALFTHCGSHCTNLVAQKVCSESQLVRNTVQLVQEIGAVFSASIHCRTTFSRVTENASDPHSIKPLCPTRWLVRVPAIQDIVNQYESVLTTLDEVSQKSIPVSARANGLAAQLRQGSTLLGLKMSLLVLQPIETLNKSLQARTMTVAGMLQAVNVVLSELQYMRNERVFDNLLSSAQELITELEIEELSVPRRRQLPARLAGGAAAQYVPTSIAEHFQPQFYEAVDMAMSGLRDRFTDSEGLQAYGELENIILHNNSVGVTVDAKQLERVTKYPELCLEDLTLQLAMFHRKYSVQTVNDIAVTFKQMVPEVRELFSQVEVLLRLLLVCPASSTEAERSFSGLRRLKSWLRSTMTQQRLNGLCVCHIHQERLDKIDVQQLLKEFCSRSEVRVKLFGHLD